MGEGSHGGELPGGRAHDTQPFVLPLDRVELELEKLGDVPDEREDLSHTVLDGRHHGEEVYDGLRDRLHFLRGRYQKPCKVMDNGRTNL